MFLDKADEMAVALSPAFKTPSGIRLGGAETPVQNDARRRKP